MISPPSDRKEFQGIRDFYSQTVAPFLAAREDARQNALMQSGLIAIATAFVSLAIYFFGPFLTANIQFAGFAAIGGAGATAWRLNKTRREISDGLLELVCDWIGYEYTPRLSRPYYAEVFSSYGLLPNYNREEWEDEVKGTRHGAGFEFCEAHLKYRSSGKNKSTRTVFHGQLLVIDYHKKFLGETVIKRDAGLLNRFSKPGNRFSQVGLASSKFEKLFEAWSTDQVEARELLDPLVLERFEELDRIFDGAKLRAVFADGKLFVAMETGDKLQMGTMFKPLETPERLEAIVKEFDVIFDLIDVVLKQINQPISGAFSVEAVR